MRELLNIVLLVLCVLLALPVGVLLLQVLCAVWPRSPDLLPVMDRPRLAVLIPAHNESGGIIATLESVLPQLQAGDRCVVVADNCSDDTAALATKAGAEVVERCNTTLRGKGYALDFGVQHLASSLELKAPDQVIIVDADCIVMPGALDRLARVCAARSRPVQALYLMKAPRSDTAQSVRAMTPIAEFAWLVRNLVRPLGFHRLGLPCQLMGSGMAFPWKALRSIQLASGHLVEDMKMGLDFAQRGIPPLFCPDALVLSHFPSSEEGQQSQRARWEHGHLGMIIGTAPGLFFKGLLMRRVALLAMAVDLCVPPLALLALMVLAMVALSAVFAWMSASYLALQFSIALLLMFGAAVTLSWLRFGQEVLTFGRLLWAVAYAFRKIPLYLKFMIRRQVDWVRSKRDAD